MADNGEVNNKDGDLDPPNISFHTNFVQVRRSKTDGRGVYAKKDFSNGNIIEVFTLMPLQYRARYQHDPAILSIGFVHDTCDCQECKKHGPTIFIPQGFASLYGLTESKRSNARFVLDYDNFHGRIVATKDIKKDEEILGRIEEQFYFKTYVAPKINLASGQPIDETGK